MLLSDTRCNKNISKINNQPPPPSYLGVLSAVVVVRLGIVGVVAGDVVDSAAQSVPVSGRRCAGHRRIVRPVRVSTTVFVLGYILVMMPHTELRSIITWELLLFLSQCSLAGVDFSLSWSELRDLSASTHSRGFSQELASVRLL